MCAGSSSGRGKEMTGLKTDEISIVVSDAGGLFLRVMTLRNLKDPLIDMLPIDLNDAPLNVYDSKWGTSKQRFVQV